MRDLAISRHAYALKVGTPEQCPVNSKIRGQIETDRFCVSESLFHPSTKKTCCSQGSGCQKLAGQCFALAAGPTCPSAPMHGKGLSQHTGRLFQTVSFYPHTRFLRTKRKESCSLLSRHQARKRVPAATKAPPPLYPLGKGAGRGGDLIY